MAYRLPGSAANEQIVRLNSRDQFAPPAAGMNDGGQRHYNAAPGQFTTDLAQLGQVLTPPNVVYNAPGATPTWAINGQPPAGSVFFTALAANITNLSTNFTQGTPVEGQLLTLGFLDNGTVRTIAWGADFVAGAGVGLPANTILSTLCTAQFIYNGAAWQLISTWCDNSTGTITGESTGVKFQLSQTTKAAMVYCTLTTAVAFNVTIGPSTGAEFVVINSSATSTGRLDFSFRLPAGYFIIFNTTSGDLDATWMTCP